MQTSALLTLFFLSTTAVIAQPQFTDAPVLGEKDMVITVIESTHQCNASPGVYQLAEDGYSMIVALEALPENAPEMVMRRNSDKVMSVLKTVGSENFQIRDYREFWIDECSKQSQYVLVEKDMNSYSAALSD